MYLINIPNYLKTESSIQYCEIYIHLLRVIEESLWSYLNRLEDSFLVSGIIKYTKQTLVREIVTYYSNTLKMGREKLPEDPGEKLRYSAHGIVPRQTFAPFSRERIEHYSRAHNRMAPEWLRSCNAIILLPAQLRQYLPLTRWPKKVSKALQGLFSFKLSSSLHINLFSRLFCFLLSLSLSHRPTELSVQR